MTTVTSTTSAGTSAASTSQTGLMANYELFLSILTTQIQNQDPLDPMDSSEYTNQLVQYSNVEQSIQTNQKLEDMIAVLESNHNMNYVSYLGNEVTADASTALLSGGSASWSVDVDEYASGTYEIRNSAGTVVYTGETELNSGNSSFNWNGITTEGTQAVDGSYSVHFNLRDGNDNQEVVSTSIKGIVDSVDWSSGSLVLTVDGREVPVSSIQSVSTPS